MSSSINPATVAKIAHLARLSHTPSEEFLDKFSQELTSVLGYADQLKEVNVDSIDALSGMRTITIDELRVDDPVTDTEKYNRQRQNIINNFPTSQNNLLIIPGIFEND